MSRYHLKQYEKEHMKMAMLKQEETFRQQVQELHRLYRVQKLLMTADDVAANEATAMPAAARCDILGDDERRAAENDAGSSKSWDGAYYSQPQLEKMAAPPLLALQESELELTLALGCFGTAVAGKEQAAAKKETASSSVDSRTSISSSSTESGGASPDCGVRRPSPASLFDRSVLPGKPGGASSVGQSLDQEGLQLQQQPPWLHKCLNLAR